MKKVALLLFASIITYQLASSQSNNTILLVGNKFSRSIKLGNSDIYQLQLEKNQFAVLDLKQKGIDLKIETFSPDGKKIEEFDSPNGKDGHEIILIDAFTNGLYNVKVSPLAEVKKEKKGDYEIELIAINNSVESHLNIVLETLYSRQHIPGFGVSIVNAKKILYKNAMGYANLAEKRPYTTETVQSIASISKTFIGLSLMKLVEQKKLTLDTPINDILPFDVVNPYFPNKTITIKHLATHTSTINEKGFYNKAFVLLDNEALEKYDYHEHFKKDLLKASKNKRITMRDFLERYLSTKGKDYKKKNFFKAEPGENWYYSNVGASLAAFIVEIASGEPYDEFVIKNIINPLQLKSAMWSGKVDEKFTLATQYDSKGNPLPNRTTITYPDGEMYINVSDLSNYLMMFINANLGKNSIILSSDSLKEMMKVQHEQLIDNFKGRKSGLFWKTSTIGIMGHSGGDSGVSARMFFDPSTNLGFTYVCNIMPLESDYSTAESRSIWSVLKRYAYYLNGLN